jgi:hypothetical protein
MARNTLLRKCFWYEIVVQYSMAGIMPKRLPFVVPCLISDLQAQAPRKSEEKKKK